jgi:nucleoside-diphosphate-sugar epimerase
MDEPRVGAFVAGATGYTGREVVRILAGTGAAVTAHVRPDSPRLGEWKRRFEAQGAVVDTTQWQEEAMRETLARLRPDRIFALLGTTKARVREAAARGGRDSYETVDFGLTALLIRAAVDAGIKPRFVYLSAAGVKRGGRSAYYRARWEAETLLRESGLPFTIARPSFITGPGRDDRRPLERAGAAVVDAGLSLAGLLGGRRLQERYRSTTSRALAAALVRLAGDTGAEGKIAESEDLR